MRDMTDNEIIKAAEIEKYKSGMIANAEVVKTLINELKTAKSEAIKEFAEKLKNCFAISGDYLDIINIIDNLVKEMTEQANFTKN